MTSVAPKQTALPSRDPGIAELSKRPFDPLKESLPGSYPDTPENESEKISFPTTATTTTTTTMTSGAHAQQGKGSGITGSAKHYATVSDPTRTGVGKPVTVDPEQQRKREIGTEQVASPSSIEQNKFKKPATRGKEFERYSTPNEPSTGVGRPVTLDPTHERTKENERATAAGPVLAASGVADKSKFEPAPRGKEFEQYSTPDDPSTGVARPISLDPAHETEKASAGPVLAPSGVADQTRFKPAPRGKEFEQYTMPDDPSTGVARPITLDPMEKERKNEEAIGGAVLAPSGAADADKFKPAPRGKEFEQYTTPDDPSTGVARPITLDPMEKGTEAQKTPVVLAAGGAADADKFKPAPRGKEFEQYSTPDDPSTGVARPITLQAGQNMATEIPEQDKTKSERFPEASDPGSTGVGKPTTLDPFERADSEMFSVNPLPASSGVGNPVTLAPGEKIPPPSDVTPSTVQSTVRTDREGYEKDASAFIAPGMASSASFEREFPLTSTDLDPENPKSRRFSGGPFDTTDTSTTTAPGASRAGGTTQTGETGELQVPSPDTSGANLPKERRLTDTGIAIESVTPMATTAGLAAGVPKESREGGTVGDDGGNGFGSGGEAVAVKTRSTFSPLKKAESEAMSPQKPDEEVPGIVKESFYKSHRDPEAAGNHEAVEDKREMEDELLRTVSPDESAGTPGPTASATYMEAAPRPTAAPGVEAPKETDIENRSKTKTTTPPTTSTATTGGPTVTTGLANAKTSELSKGTETVPSKGEHEYERGHHRQTSRDTATLNENGTAAGTDPAAAAAAAAASHSNNRTGVPETQTKSGIGTGTGTGTGTETVGTTGTTYKETKPVKEAHPDGNIQTTGNTAASNRADRADGAIGKEDSIARDLAERERKRKHRGFFAKIKDMLK